MKNKAILLLLLLPCIAFSQDDDYCSCMEADNSQDNLANLLTNHQTAINIWQTPSHQFQRQRVVVPPKEEIVSVTIVTEALIKEDSLNKLETLVDLEPLIEEPEEEIQKENIGRRISNSSKKPIKKAKVKRKLKRLKGKVKKRKKMRKYKGGCPGF